MEIEKLRKEYDLSVDWRPFFLRPETPPEGSPLPAYVRERMKDPNDPLKKRAEREGLKMVRRDFVPSTRRAHEAAEFARARGKLEPMHAELLKAYWTEGKDLYSFDVLRDAAYPGNRRRREELHRPLPRFAGGGARPAGAAGNRQEPPHSRNPG